MFENSKFSGQIRTNIGKLMNNLFYIYDQELDVFRINELILNSRQVLTVQLANISNFPLYYQYA